MPHHHHHTQHKRTRKEQQKGEGIHVLPVVLLRYILSMLSDPRSIRHLALTCKDSWTDVVKSLRFKEEEEDSVLGCLPLCFRMASGAKPCVGRHLWPSLEVGFPMNLLLGRMSFRLKGFLPPPAGAAGAAVPNWTGDSIDVQVVMFDKERHLQSYLRVLEGTFTLYRDDRRCSNFTLEYLLVNTVPQSQYCIGYTKYGRGRRMVSARREKGGVLIRAGNKGKSVAQFGIAPESDLGPLIQKWDAHDSRPISGSELSLRFAESMLSLVLAGVDCL